jgi:hypothetical protein
VKRHPELAITLGKSFRVLACLALALLALEAGAADDSASTSLSLEEQGRLLYQTGLRPDGTAVPAIVHGDVVLPGGAGACISCHRRSGIGVAEGGAVRSLNLTGAALFARSDKPPIRPAYDYDSLVKAMKTGVVPGGRVLDPIMPLYDLTATEAKALVAYLSVLGNESSAGVSDTDIQIGMVLAPDAPAHEREAALAVANRWVEIKNAESRLESKRAAASNRHYYGRSMQRAFRIWKLHVLSLEGAQDSWPGQLRRFYSQNTPFAMVAGAAGPGWPVIDRFCEHFEIPCILPQTDYVPYGEPGFYSLYYSSGVKLEAAVTAEHMLESRLEPGTRILLLHPDDAAGQASLAIWREQLDRAGFDNISTSALRADRPLSPQAWDSVLRREQTAVMISLVPANTLNGLVAGSRDSAGLPGVIYTAASSSDWTASPVVHAGLVQRIRHVYPYTLPRGGTAQFPREAVWLKKQGLSELDPLAASKALFAFKALGMGLMDIQSNFSGAYLLEMFEHSLDGTRLTSVYPKTSLGPDQRFLARGAWVVRLSGDPGTPYTGEEWIQP